MFTAEADDQNNEMRTKSESTKATQNHRIYLYIIIGAGSACGLLVVGAVVAVVVRSRRAHPSPPPQLRCYLMAVNRKLSTDSNVYISKDLKSPFFNDTVSFIQINTI